MVKNEKEHPDDLELISYKTSEWEAQTQDGIVTLHSEKRTYQPKKETLKILR